MYQRAPGSSHESFSVSNSKTFARRQVVKGGDVKEENKVNGGHKKWKGVIDAMKADKEAIAAKKQKRNNSAI